jgi:hypothetical protein
MIGLGAGYLIEFRIAEARADEVTAFRIKRDQEDVAMREKMEAAQNEGVQRMKQNEEMLAQASLACQQQFSQATLIYETPANAQIASGVRGLLGLPVNMTPGSNVAPHWYIPAKVKPMFYGPAQGAIYYYLGGDGKIDGPYMPEPAR